MLTILTPTYNRAYIIENLYRSLKRQTSNNFEWLIIDDGSIDNTETLIHTFITESLISIRYIKQPNGGKHRAINRGVAECKSELVFIVDSDDYLADNAIERVLFHYSDIKDNTTFAGVCGLRAFRDGKRIGGEAVWDILDCDAFEFRFKRKVQGDMAEVFKTDILRKYPFPEFDGEIFCPEALVWYRIAKEYKLRYFAEKIYYCDYLPDGLSSKIVALRMENWKATTMYYSELYRNIGIWDQKIKSAINYWRFALCSNEKLSKIYKSTKPVGILFIPLGWIYHLIDILKVSLLHR